MSKTKHTPGPLEYCFEGGTVAFIVEPDGTVVAKLSVIENTSGHSALVANTRLFAAAPELLKALEKALLMCDKMTDGNGPYKYIDGTQLVSDAYDTSNLLKQAIAKAKGEQP